MIFSKSRTKRREEKESNVSNLINVSNVSDLSGFDLDSFKSLGLEEPVLRALRALKFKTPTAIQEKAIPLVLAGRDIIAGSETGSGKTLAFGAGIIQSAKSREGVQALILTPTRELAEQVSESMKSFSRNTRLRVAAVYGGVSINPQINALRSADVVVATPGRMLDHINRGTVRLDRVKTVVLDEADTMLDMGFIRDVEKIIKACPQERQTLLFSATITNDVYGLAKRHTKNAEKISTKTSVDPGKLTQIRYDISSNLKFSLLVYLLRNEKADLAMVFCNTRRSTDVVTKNLKSMGIEAKAIHGGFSQEKRKQAITLFHTKKIDVLICTDVAARGLDISGVSHVYNYDIPADSRQYIHRIGRTARAGKAGKAISILSKRDYENFSKVMKDNSIYVAKEKAPQLERANIRFSA